MCLKLLCAAGFLIAPQLSLPVALISKTVQACLFAGVCV